MMTKIAHMRENRKNNKGFSLVELIIVMAIMVALVAVLAPQYIRYLQRSRDAVVINAGEDVLTAIKTDLIDPDGTLKITSTSATVIVKAGADGKGGVITVVPSGFDGDAESTIKELAGISTREVKSEKQVTISITKDSDGTFKFESDGGNPTTTTTSQAAGG